MITEQLKIQSLEAQIAWMKDKSTRIEVYCIGVWREIKEPSWHSQHTYRIAKEPEPRNLYQELNNPMNEINLKKGDRVLVRDNYESEWIARGFHHFYEDKIICFYGDDTDTLVIWKYWKLPDPPKPEKKEYWVNWYGDEIGCAFNYKESCYHGRDSGRTVSAILKVTQEEGKLPVVEVIQPD